MKAILYGNRGKAFVKQLTLFGESRATALTKPHVEISKASHREYTTDFFWQTIG